MKTAVKFLCAFLLSVVLVGCGQTVTVLHHTSSFPPPSLLVDYDVPPPPMQAEEYATLGWEDKEELWVSYTKELFGIINQHMSDKKGIRLWESELKTSLDKLNNPKDSKK
jgi:hypothetical protein